MTTTNPYPEVPIPRPAPSTALLGKDVGPCPRDRMDG
jgi:hypothetical protein